VRACERCAATGEDTCLDLELADVGGQTAEEDLAARVLGPLVAPCGWHLARLVSEQLPLGAVVVCEPSLHLGPPRA
jgi:hypothetical protein